MHFREYSSSAFTSILRPKTVQICADSVSPSTSRGFYSIFPSCLRIFFKFNFPWGTLRRDEGVDHAIKVVEEWEEVEGEFDPALPLAFVQRVCVHDARGVVEAGAAHHGSIHVPVHVVSDEGDIEEEWEELSTDEEEGVEEDVEDVLGQDERVEAVALVDRVLVVRL